MRFHYLSALIGAIVLMFSTASNLQASCVTPTPVSHLLDSYFLCDDGLPTFGYAYQQSDPATTNSNGVKITCEDTIGYGCIPSSGIPGDGQLTIGADWYLPGMNGCPTLPSPQRIVIVVVAPRPLGATGLIASLSGNDPNVGYAVEAAQPFDQGSSQTLPVACDQTF